MKNLVKFFFILSTLLVCGCSNSGTKQHSAQNDSIADPLRDLAADSLQAYLRNAKPSFGYRFIIEGDFDGDGKKEKLTEHYFSALTHKETDKFYQDVEYSDLVDLTIKKEPYSFMLCDNPAIDTLHISSDPQLFGISYLKNEGDLNGDGTDEISYVINWADWSNLNTWHIVTYKNHQWAELYSFPIWDWQLPDVPEALNDYGLFGTQGKLISTGNDTINDAMQKEMDKFEGLVKKIRNKKIQVIFRNDEADQDTMTVDLN